jgi:hypothetical protein
LESRWGRALERDRRRNTAQGAAISGVASQSRQDRFTGCPHWFGRWLAKVCPHTHRASGRGPSPECRLMNGLRAGAAAATSRSTPLPPGLCSRFASCTTSLFSCTGDPQEGRQKRDGRWNAACGNDPTRHGLDTTFAGVGPRECRPKAGPYPYGPFAPSGEAETRAKEAGQPAHRRGHAAQTGSSWQSLNMRWPSNLGHDPLTDPSVGGILRAPGDIGSGGNL